MCKVRGRTGGEKVVTVMGVSADVDESGWRLRRCVCEVAMRTGGEKVCAVMRVTAIVDGGC